MGRLKDQDLVPPEMISLVKRNNCGKVITIKVHYKMYLYHSWREGVGKIRSSAGNSTSLVNSRFALQLDNRICVTF